MRKLANDAGIPIVYVNREPIDVGALGAKGAFVGSNEVDSGTLETQEVCRILKEAGKTEANIYVIMGELSNQAAVQRTADIHDVMASGNCGVTLNIIDEQTANWSRAESMGLMENWLTAFPGQIQGVIAQNDDEALGAVQAIKTKGIDIKTIPVVGVDGVAAAITAVKRGEMTTNFQDAQAQAQGALDVLLRQLVGPSYRPRSVVWSEYAQAMPWGDGTAKSYEVPWTAIVPANADAFLQKVRK